MGLEMAIGLAHLSGRSLSMPVDVPVGPSPTDAVGDDRGRAALVSDFWEIPVEIVPDDEWKRFSRRNQKVDLQWGSLSMGVLAHPHDVDRSDPTFVDFANGRSDIWSFTPDLDDVPALEVHGRPLGMYTYFFYVRGEARRELEALLQQVRPRQPYRDLGEAVARSLGSFNSAHIRRSDLLIGLPAYRRIMPRQIASNLQTVLPVDEPLVVCTEAPSDSEVFLPLLEAYSDVVFLNDVLLGSEWRSSFFDLPVHDASALGLVSQEVVKFADRFVGTIGSTFTAMVQRYRVLQDPTTPFWFTADYTPEGPVFHDCAYHDRAPGRFSWNRIAYSMSPDVLTWFREWPETGGTPELA